MTSEQPTYDHDTIVKELHSADPVKVMEAIEALRVAGKTSDIPLLLDLLHQSSNPEVKAKIFALLANLKDADTIPLIIEAIRNEKYASELKKLVSCCWENGLDYTPYLSVFVDLMIESDFLVAFEAYTVITNMVTTIDQIKLDTEIEKLDKSLHSTSDEKKVLLLEVIDFLPSIGF